MTIYGLDVSNHQGNMTTLGGVAAKFFISKLTEGTTFTDGNASHNLAFAKSNNIKLTGGYHFIRAGNGSAQADWFIKRARQLFGTELNGNLWQLDCEADATEADVRAFKARWDAVTGNVPIFFYTGDWWLQPRGWNVAAMGFAGLWSAPNAGYVGRANAVKATDWAGNYGGFGKITILQYDARSSVGDTNMFNGTLAQLQALCTRREPSGDGNGEDTDMKLVEVSLGASPMDLTFGSFGQVNWSEEYADPANEHADTPKDRPQGYPGYVPSHSAYVNGTVYVHLTGQEAGDQVQVRLAKNGWDAKASKITTTAYEYLWDQPASTGEQYLTLPMRAYAHAGEHWYIQVAVLPKDGTDPAAARPDLKLVGATWRPYQMVKG